MRLAAGRPSPRRRGFTLVELTAVLLLAALIATGVTVSLKGARRDTLLDDAVLRWKAYDEATRAQARRSGGPLRLRIGIDAGRARRLAADDNRPLGGTLDFPPGPDGVRIERVLTPADDAGGGDVDVRVSARGYSPPYAVLLGGPGGRRQWVLFAGLTGEASLGHDDRQVLDTIRLAAAGGDDPD